MDMNDPRQVALLKGRASLSGVQPKFTLVREKGKFRPARSGETSTHIAKFPSADHLDLIMNEYLTMHAFKKLLPDDDVADVTIDTVQGSSDPALIIRRFDRTSDGKRIHFEEFNQLLGRASQAKYDGSHEEMADFIRHTPGCLPAEIYRLYLRILAGMLLGNTDMHFKNFAMFHTPEGLRLTPSYDQVAAALYGYKTVALAIGGAADLSWSALKAKSLVRLGDEFGLPAAAISMAHEQFAKRKEAMLDSIAQEDLAAKKLKESLIQLVKKRWNGTFSLIGQALSKKR